MSSNQKQRTKALGKFDLVDDRMKLTNSIWGGCTRAANSMGMTDEERMKLIAVNLVTQNQLLLNAVATQTERIDVLSELLAKIHDSNNGKGYEVPCEEIALTLASYSAPPTTLAEIMPPKAEVLSQDEPETPIDPDGE